jgi:hypothetical protein
MMSVADVLLVWLVALSRASWDRKFPLEMPLMAIFFLTG